MPWNDPYEPVYNFSLYNDLYYWETNPSIGVGSITVLNYKWLRAMTSDTFGFLKEKEFLTYVGCELTPTSGRETLCS